jgi:hypothetical protein
MRRAYLGLGILATLLALCIGIWWGMDRVHGGIADLLIQGQAAAEKDDWQGAETFALQARARWEQHHRFTAAFADHTPMDEMDGLFAELEVFLQNRESPHFESTCARLILLTRAMADSHGVQWWNVL